jgi:hypothetical protein
MMRSHHGIGVTGGTGLVMVRVNGIECVSMPDVPLIVRGYVALTASAPTLILMIEYAFPPSGGGFGAWRDWTGLSGVAGCGVLFR